MPPFDYLVRASRRDWARRFGARRHPADVLMDEVR
jgi:hypothetical protein